MNYQLTCRTSGTARFGGHEELGASWLSRHFPTSVVENLMQGMEEGWLFSRVAQLLCGIHSCRRHFSVDSVLT